MNLRPRTLLSRLMILIALLLILGQFAAFRLFDYFEREPRAAAAALQAVSVVSLTRSALLAAQEDRRLPLLQELSQREGIRVYPVDLFEVIEPLPRDPLTRRIVDHIRAALGPETLIAYNHLGLRGLWVSFVVDEDAFWVVIPNVQVEERFPWEWLGWGALILAISLIGAYLIAARINRPLRLLTHAADDIAQGKIPEKLPEDGAEELQHVNQTFNTMTESLARLDAERTLLLAGVSHDLRTPLARLRLAVEMLPEALTLRAGMVQDIEDMDGIIRQFLDFIRGIEGEAPDSCDLNDIIRGLAQRYQRLGQSLQLHLQNLPELPLRRQAIQRMLTNLIDNAYKYGSESVTLTSTHDAGHIVISITDEGPGIPTTEMARLLRPFERLDQSRGNSSNSGLGLAIAERIAKLHGGALELFNRSEGGLEVRISLPA